MISRACRALQGHIVFREVSQNMREQFADLDDRGDFYTIVLQEDLPVVMEAVSAFTGLDASDSRALPKVHLQALIDLCPRLHGFGFRKRQDFVAIIPDACRHLDEAKEIRELVRSPELTLRGWTLAATTSSWL